MTPSAYEVDPERLIAHSQHFASLVSRAAEIAQNLANALIQNDEKQASLDVYGLSLSAAHDGLAAEAERQIALLPERLHEFGKSFLLAAHLYQAGEEKAVEALANLPKPSSPSESG